MRLVLKLGLVALLAVWLAACDTAEERAERHYQSALALLDEGEVERAMVELLNVFRLDGSHREARRTFAMVQLDRGELADAYGNFLRLVEFYPDDLPARLQLAEMSVVARNWDEVERHARMAGQLDPDAPRVRALLAALAYRDAVRGEDAEARAAAAAEAQAVLDADPATIVARTLVIDHLVFEGARRPALDQIDIALGFAPDRYDLYQLQLRLLAEEGDDDALEARLEAAFARFPEDVRLRDSLIAWHVRRDQPERAVAFLRTLAARSPGDEWPRLALVALLRDTSGAGAARAELDALIAEAEAAGAPSMVYRVARAELDFATGDRAAARSDLDDLLAAAETGQARNDAAVVLAGMLLRDGAMAEARARVAEVLAADPAHVGALKLEASWLIDEDRPADALRALRQALTQEPRDPAIMSLMAEAHLREGNRDLAAERLALAVELSGRATAESLRYARFLADAGRLAPAEAILEDGLRANPGQARLLTALAEVRMRRGSHDRAARAIAALGGLDDPAARADAIRLQADLLEARDRGQELAGFLESVLARGQGDLSTIARIVQARLAQGELDEAARYLDALLVEDGENAMLRFLRAGVHQAAGQTARAERLYRALHAEAPGAEGPTRALVAMLSRDGRTDEARAILQASLQAQPGSVVLRWMEASAREAEGDAEGAIAIYDQLYREDTANALFANNLASLLSTRRSDAESLERAHAIARRLRDSDVPAFADTYGWIAYRRGDLAVALAHLEAAARAMPDVAQAQYHLGTVYAALGRLEEARATLAHARDLAADDPRAGHVHAEAEALLATLPLPAEPPAEPLADQHGAGAAGTGTGQGNGIGTGIGAVPDLGGATGAPAAPVSSAPPVSSVPPMPGTGGQGAGQ